MDTRMNDDDFACNSLMLTKCRILFTPAYFTTYDYVEIDQMTYLLVQLDRVPTYLL